MRRIIACVIVGLVTAIAIYQLRKVKRSTHTAIHLPVPFNVKKHIQSSVVLYFPLPVQVLVYE